MTSVVVDGQTVPMSPVGAQALLEIRDWDRDHHGAAYPRGAVHPATRQRLVAAGLIEDRPGGLMITGAGEVVALQLDTPEPAA